MCIESKIDHCTIGSITKSILDGGFFHKELVLLMWEFAGVEETSFCEFELENQSAICGISTMYYLIYATPGKIFRVHASITLYCSSDIKTVVKDSIFWKRCALPI